MLAKEDAANLLGVDVGFSTSRVTTAIALLDGNQLHLARRNRVGSRAAQIPGDFPASVIAIDGPLLPQGADDHIYRSCEAVFIRSPFHDRCKPGLSHWGFGLQLRRASTEACAQFSHLLMSSLEEHKNVHYDGPIAEAFPNAFLAVLIPEVELLSAPRLKRGRRFDWLCEQIATTGRLEFILSKKLDMPGELWVRLRTEKDHELRAALGQLSFAFDRSSCGARHGCHRRRIDRRLVLATAVVRVAGLGKTGTWRCCKKNGVERLFSGLVGASFRGRLGPIKENRLSSNLLRTPTSDNGLNINYLSLALIISATP
jgi:hypothetical protein